MTVNGRGISRTMSMWHVLANQVLYLGLFFNWTFISNKFCSTFCLCYPVLCSWCRRRVEIFFKVWWCYRTASEG